MTRPAARRRFLAACGAAALSGLAGCTAIESRLPVDLPFGAENPGRPLTLAERVDAEGSWNVIVPGDHMEDRLRYHYRTETGPLDMESNVGGRAAAIPEANGVRVELDLTEDDVYGAAAIRFGPFDLSSISEIRFSADDDIRVALPLGIAYNDGTIAAWEQTTDGRERWVGFDGDDVAIGRPLASGASPITRDEWLFRSPPTGSVDAFPTKSLDALEEMFGDIPVQVSASIDGVSGESRSAVIEEFEVVRDR